MQIPSSAVFAPDDLEAASGRAHSSCMTRTKTTKRPLHKTFIKQWRKHRRLSQEVLADRLEISHTTLSRIERGEVPYNQRFLEAAAEALRCEAADLLMRDPTDPEGIWSIWGNLSGQQRQQAVAIIRAIKSTGTDG